jgi:hypothetical protein
MKCLSCSDEARNGSNYCGAHFPRYRDTWNPMVGVYALVTGLCFIPCSIAVLIHAYKGGLDIAWCVVYILLIISSIVVSYKAGAANGT